MMILQINSDTATSSEYDKPTVISYFEFDINSNCTDEREVVD